MTFVVAAPAGMRDLLPPYAGNRARLASHLTRLFESWGYQLVTTAPFEHEGVIQRGLDRLDRRDLLRFVDPESGEVALLRPDLTPQIARIVATQLGDRPPPFRLCTSGMLIRRRRGRARRQRQIAQAGVELIGMEAPDGDVEVIRLASAALEAAGLSDFTVELSLTSLTRALLLEVDEDARDDAEEALLRKDEAELGRVLHRAGAPRLLAERLTAATRLYGEPTILRRAHRVFPDQPALRDLKTLVSRLRAEGLGPRLVVDLGEARGAEYYTGASFTLIAPGPGEPVGRGGRYDSLLSRFGLPAPATGFGLDLSHIEWARSIAGAAHARTRPARFVLAGGSRDKQRELADAMRATGAQVAALGKRGGTEALDYARAWGYDATVVPTRGGWRTVRVSDQKRRSFTLGRVASIMDWARKGTT